MGYLFMNDSKLCENWHKFVEISFGKDAAILVPIVLYRKTNTNSILCITLKLLHSV
jgi:hypothetical protein